MRDRLLGVLSSPTAKQFYVSIAVLAVATLALAVSVLLAGLVATIVYAFLFLLMLFAAPSLIGLMGRSTPGNGSLGKGHFILGQFAAGHGYLVQVRDQYKLCVGTADRVLIDGDWYEITDGKSNMTVLGWRPFGVLWFKDEDELQRARVDPNAKSRVGADGGSHDVQRAGIEEVRPDPSVSGMDGKWLVDVKRLYSRGLQRIGNLDLLEQSEEQAMRDEVGTSRTREWSTVIGGVLGLAIGVVTGYAWFML